MAEIRKRRRLSASGSFSTDDIPEITKDDTIENTTPAKPQQRRTLFVRSLPASATTETLTDHFSQSYPLKHATAVVDPETKQSKGYGFVTFTDAEDAQQALKEFNGSTFEGKKIKVELAEPRHRDKDENGDKSSLSATAAEKLKKEREERRAQAQPPKLIVRNLPWSVKEPEQLEVLFRSFGKIKHATIPKKGQTQAGFGFVVMRGRKNAEKAIAAVNGKEVDGRTLAVDWAVEKSVWEDSQKPAEEVSDKREEVAVEEDIGEAQGDEEHLDNEMDEGSISGDDDGSDEDISMGDADDMESEDEPNDKEDERNSTTIFIRNLPFTTDDDSLYEHFTQFGPLRYARVVVDPGTDRSRGTGFVCFWKAEDADTCIREAPRTTIQALPEKDKGRSSTVLKHSVLEDANMDPSGKYSLDGRVLQVSRAVSRTEAHKLEEEGTSRRNDRDRDKRRLYLLSEGTVPNGSALYKKLSPMEIKMREASTKQRQTLLKSNPMLHISLTRLSVRNIPRNITSKDLKALAREAVVGFAKDVKGNLRQPLSKEELHRGNEAQREAEKLRKMKGKGIVKQAKVVFEGREGSKISEKSGAGRSRGYGFIEYSTHRSALMGLRWLNGHAVDARSASNEEPKEKKKRLVVEFAIENAQVVGRRQERESKSRVHGEDGDEKGQNGPRRKQGDRSVGGKGKQGMKRKRSDSAPQGKAGADTPKAGPQKGESNAGDEGKDNKLAKRNRIIAKKRMMRRNRKG
ncbi:RNA recognition motif-containing protein [Arachnomyces sp. PD_36]|nr:RNA recognition motif-containing protein [Arachnomyces sp. PD_36]